MILTHTPIGVMRFIDSWHSARFLLLTLTVERILEIDFCANAQVLE